jgi:hypothetical protein
MPTLIQRERRRGQKRNKSYSLNKNPMVLNTVQDDQLAKEQNYFKFEQGVLDYTVVFYSGGLAS